MEPWTFPGEVLGMIYVTARQFWLYLMAGRCVPWLSWGPTWAPSKKDMPQPRRLKDEPLAKPRPPNMCSRQLGRLRSAVVLSLRGCSRPSHPPRGRLSHAISRGAEGGHGRTKDRPFDAIVTVGSREQQQKDATCQAHRKAEAARKSLDAAEDREEAEAAVQLSRSLEAGLRCHT